MGNATQLPAANTQFIDPREKAGIARVTQITGQSRSYVFKHMKDEEDPFPPRHIIGNKSFWVCGDLLEWNACKERGEKWNSAVPA